MFVAHVTLSREVEREREKRAVVKNEVGSSRKTNIRTIEVLAAGEAHTTPFYLAQV